ncbi:MAG: HEAT repeat domain-containing protein [Planctomycetota bacterium]|nr:HEAT repeat domain-containing protein [Planctomycetota bacterium]
MRYWLDEIIFVVAVIVGAMLFALGLRRALKTSGAKGVLGKLLLAVNMSLIAFGTLWAQEPQPPATEETQPDADKDEVAAREKLIAEVTQLKGWKELRGLWRRLLKQVSKAKSMSGEKLPTDLVDQAQKLRDELQIGPKGQPPKQEPQAQDAPLLTAEQAFREMKGLALEIYWHLTRLTEMSTCYKRAGFEGQPQPINEQMDLLEKELADGKISQAVYTRVKETMQAYASRHTRVAAHLNTRNSVLIFKLIEEICGTAQVDISQIAPELIKKVVELSVNLGDADSSVRDEAEKALVAIGDPAIPSLRNLVKNTADEEVRMRAERILAEIE